MYHPPALPSSLWIAQRTRAPFTLQHWLELELIQTQMTQKPMLRVEVGARALRNPVGRGGVRHVFLRAAAGGTNKRARRGVVGRARLHVL